MEWDGSAADGTPLGVGLYTFSVESRTAGQVTDTTRAETYSPITEARRQGTETVFVLRGGSLVQASDISGLRAPRD